MDPDTSASRGNYHAHEDIGRTEDVDRFFRLHSTRLDRFSARKPVKADFWTLRDSAQHKAPCLLMTEGQLQRDFQRSRPSRLKRRCDAADRPSAAQHQIRHRDRLSKQRTGQYVNWVPESGGVRYVVSLQSESHLGGVRQPELALQGCIQVCQPVAANRVPAEVSSQTGTWSGERCWI